MGQTLPRHQRTTQNRIDAPTLKCGSPSTRGDESVFFQEWLAGGCRKNQLPISAVCNSRCIFCSNNQNPFPIARGLFRDVEDIKHQLSLMGPYQGDIYMSESLPGRIAEGEAFLHPEFFEILKLVRRKYVGNTLCFATNGTLLDEVFVRELSRFRPIRIRLSMHTTRPDLWARIFGRSSRDAEKALGASLLIRKYRMDLEGAMVVLPRICGWDDIETTYETLVTQGAKSMILWRPGYSRLMHHETIRAIECPVEEFLEFSDRMRKVHRVPVAYYPSMHGAPDVDVSRIVSVTLRGNSRNGFGPYRRVLWLTSEAAHDLIAGELHKRAATGGNIHLVAPVRNRTYGGNIIVGGLLMADDFIAAGREVLDVYPDTELVLVPKIPFDRHERDLAGKPAYRIAEELGRPVWVVTPDGSFNPLLEGYFDRNRPVTISMDGMDCVRRSGGGEEAGAQHEPHPCGYSEEAPRHAGAAAMPQEEAIPSGERGSRCR